MGLSIRPIPSIHQVFKWWEGLNAQQKMATAQERHPLVCFAMDPIETFTSEAYPKHNLCCDNAPFAYSPASPQKTYVLYTYMDTRTQQRLHEHGHSCPKQHTATTICKVFFFKMAERLPSLQQTWKWTTPCL